MYWNHNKGYFNRLLFNELGLFVHKINPRGISQACLTRRRTRPTFLPQSSPQSLKKSPKATGRQRNKERTLESLLKGNILIKMVIMRKRLFTKDLRPMVYGFGDIMNPRPDTIDAVEDCLLEYLSRLFDQANKLCAQRGSKLRTEDVMTVLKRDSKKYGRMEELLYMNEELKRVRKAFDTEE